MLDNAGPDPAGLLAQPAKTTRKGYLTQKFARIMMAMNEFVLAGILAVLVTAVSFLIEPFAGYLPIALLYLLLVVAAGLKLRRGPVLALAATSALLWNFLFIPPHFTLHR